MVSCCAVLNDGIGHDSCWMFPARWRNPSRWSQGGEDHSADGCADAGGRQLNRIGRHTERDPAEESLHAGSVETAKYDEHREPDGEYQVQPVQQREAEQDAAEQDVPPAPLGIGGPSAFERQRQAEQPECDAADPAQRGEPDGRDDDDERDQRARERHRASPVARQREDAEDHADLLQERYQTLGRERGAEHLVHAGQQPEAAGPVEVEEVPVRQVAVQHPLREDEHEALFHRRSLAAEQAAQRDQERERDDAEHDRVALAGCEAAPPTRCGCFGRSSLGALAGDLCAHDPRRGAGVIGRAR